MELTLKLWQEGLEKDFRLTNNRAITPISALDSPQVALLAKRSAVSLSVRISAILIDMMSLATCSWTSDGIPAVVQMIVDNYWYFRYDELLYAIKKGLSGSYGKIYGQVNYTTMADWFNQYWDGERAQTMEQIRIKKHSEAMKTKEVSAEVMYLDAMYKPKEKSEEKHVSHDERQLGLFQAFKQNYSAQQLKTQLQTATDNGWRLTSEAIAKEIETR